MVSVYEATDYKEYLKAWIEARPRKGRGESRRIAERLAVSTTLVSQVLNGDKHFTMEAASELCDYMGLVDREAEHFLLLVEYARAGSYGLKQRLKKRIERSQHAARKLSERIEKDRDLSSEERATYYSNWVYTGIRNLVATAPTMNVEDIAERLKLPSATVAQVVSFLLETGIFVNRNGSFEMGVKKTHIGADSPLVVKHHQNWRVQGFNQMIFGRDSDLFYTAPMSLSREVAEQIRNDLPAYIEKIVKWVGPSKSEVVRCLNIDWFEY